MRHIFPIFLLFCALVCSAANVAPDGESLNYRVMYKWGMVNKQAGHVNISCVKLDKRRFRSMLAASSEKWADKFYTVRDTLLGTIISATCEPLRYEKISHEGGDYKHDIVVFDRQPSSKVVTAECMRSYKKKKDTELTVENRHLEAEGLTVDMLSAFYYMRSIDYQSMHPGEKVVMNIFSGKRKEILDITYLGEENVTIGGKAYPTYKISFTFTGNEGKKTSDDMWAWISSAPDRVPLKLEGSLPVGKVQCFLIP